MTPLADAQAWLAARTPRLGAEQAPLIHAGARILAATVRATALPPHPVAAIDGHAVRAAETEGASDYAPLPIGDAPVAAGAPLPPGTDAVLSYAALDAGPVALAPAARGSGVLPPGHDAAEGWTLPSGTVLRPLHLALLARLGYDSVAVVRRPRAQVRAAPAKSGPDALTPMLRALAAAEGAEPGETQPDLIIHAGRSGPGPDDDGVRAFTTVFAHGLALRPGETAALGTIGGIPALLLPGDPLACATVFALLAAPAFRRMAGRPEPPPVAAALARKVSSALGQIDAIRVRLDGGVATPLGPAEGGSLAAALSADGLVLVPEGSEGYPAGATVQVIPL